MTDQLSKLSWLQHGLETLANKGFEALKAEPMAKAMKVSRGSFYWHFKDIGEFRSVVLDHWRESATQEIIKATNATHSAESRLLALVNRAFDTDPKLETAIRAWASQSKDAAKATYSVDDERKNYLVELLVSEGVSPAQARHRAVFIYWAYLGRTVTKTDGPGGISETSLREIIELFLHEPTDNMR